MICGALDVGLKTEQHRGVEHADAAGEVGS